MRVLRKLCSDLLTRYDCIPWISKLKPRNSWGFPGIFVPSNCPVPWNSSAYANPPRRIGTSRNSPEVPGRSSGNSRNSLELPRN